jgi:hypothetical protein
MTPKTAAKIKIKLELEPEPRNDFGLLPDHGRLAARQSR